MKYIIFDRDGTLIEHVNYLFEPNKVSLVPGVKCLFRRLIQENCLLFLHTNQSGVGRGYFSIDDVIKCNSKMIEQIGLGNNIFKKICIAEDFPPGPNSYRKPSNKFGLEILIKYKIEPKDLYYVGDSKCDIETAENLGCNFIFVSQKESKKITTRKGNTYSSYTCIKEAFLNEFYNKN